MYGLKIENAGGDVLDLIAAKEYIVTSVEGLEPPSMNVNTSESAAFDGSLFNSVRGSERNIVITLKITRYGEGIEANRNALYDHFKLKEKIRVHYSNGIYEDVYEDGYIEQFECDLFTMNEKATISIICPTPFWAAATQSTLVLTASEDLFEFPFDIGEEGIEFSRVTAEGITATLVNGSIPWGIYAELDLQADAAGITITNITTGEYFEMSGNYQAGDKLVLDTRTGSKAFYKLSGGVKTNLLPDRGNGSVWITLKQGLNDIEVTAESGIEGIGGIIQAFKMYWAV